MSGFAVWIGVFITAIALLGSAVADPLPNRQRRHAIETLASTATGAALLERVRGTAWEPFESVAFLEVGDARCSKLYELEPKARQLWIHCNFLSASPSYLSWVLARALVAVEVDSIARRLGARELPSFIETTQWSMLVAMRHWMELGAPNAEDYANDRDRENASFARTMLASVSDWTEVWRAHDLDVFLGAVEKTQKQLGQGAVTIQDFLATASISRRERRAVEEIASRWQEILDDECAKVSRRCPW